MQNIPGTADDERPSPPPRLPIFSDEEVRGIGGLISDAVGVLDELDESAV